MFCVAAVRCDHNPMSSIAMNVNVHQNDIYVRYKTKFNMPVTYYRQLIFVVNGNDRKPLKLA